MTKETSIAGSYIEHEDLLRITQTEVYPETSLAKKFFRFLITVLAYQFLSGFSFIINGAPGDPAKSRIECLFTV